MAITSILAGRNYWERQKGERNHYGGREEQKP